MTFARQSLWSLVALAFGILASVLLPRLLGAEARGEYALAVKVAGLVLALAQFGIPEVLLQYVAEQRDRASLAGTSLLLGLLGAILFSAILALALPLLSDSLLKGVHLDLLAIALTGSMASIVGLVARRFIQLDGKLGMYNALDVVRTGLFLGVAVVVSLLLPREAIAPTGAWFLGELFLGVAAAWYLRRRRIPRWHVDWRLAAETLLAGLPIQVGLLAMYVGNEGGSFILNARMDLATVGIYAVALSMAKLVLQISTALRTTLAARLTGAETDSAHVTARVTRHGLLWMLLVSLALLAAVPLVPFVFGREFTGAEPVLALALPGMVGYGVWQLLAGHLLRIGRRVLLGSVAVLFAAASVLLQVVGIQMAGPSGAALGLSLAYLLGAGVIVVAFRASTGISPLALLPGAAEVGFYLALPAQLRGLVRRPAARRALG